VISAERLRAETKFREGARLEVLDQDIGIRQKVSQSIAAGRTRKIEHHRALAAVEPDEVAALAMNHIVVAAREIALRPLDLEHGRSGIG
jgi:hypothetical protein